MIEATPQLSGPLDREAVDLLFRDDLQPIFVKISSEYLYWDKVKYLAPDGVKAEQLWQAVKLKRTAEYRRIRFGQYCFCYSVTPEMQQLLHEFDMRAGGNLSSGGVIPEKERQVYLVSSLMEEAIASSQMEGASTTRKVAKEMLRKQAAPANRSQQMIINNYRTIRQLVEIKDQPMSLSLLLNLHRSITGNTLDNKADEGSLRLSNDIYVVDSITGEVAHTPPPVEQLPALLQDLCAFANDDSPLSPFVHPIIKGIILHFMLAWIHPFADGNGRTARSILYWYLLKKDYWMTEYLSISRVIYRNKKRYERMYLQSEADGLDMSYFLLFSLQMMQKAYDELQSYLARKVEEQALLWQNGDVEGLNERQLKILKIIGDAPATIFTARELAVRFAITANTARADLVGLVEKGRMRKIALNGKLSGYAKA